MSIDPTKIIAETKKKIKSILESGVTDPIAGSRDSDTKFIMLAYPERKTQYPHIVIYQHSQWGERLGVPSELMRHELGISIDVFSKSTKQRDELADSVQDCLRDNLVELGNYGLFSFAWGTCFDIEGEDAHVKHIEVSYKVIAKSV